MRSINKELLILINQKICALYNQESKVVNEAALESCFSVFNSYYDSEEQVAAAFFRAVITSHAFMDANKRTASVALWYINPGKINAYELAELAVDVAKNTSIAVEEIVQRVYKIQVESYKPTYTYSYKGPVYRFEKVYTVLKDPIYTTAQNEKQAATMIKGKLKKMFGFDVNAKLDIDDNNVMKSIQQNNEYQYYQNKKKEHKKDLSGAEFIGSIDDNDIYYLDGYYIANDIAFASYEDARDYLED